MSQSCPSSSFEHFHCIKNYCLSYCIGCFTTYKKQENLLKYCTHRFCNCIYTIRIVICKHLRNIRIPVISSFPFIKVIAGNLLPCRILPKLYHFFLRKSKNSKDDSDGFASEDPPATTIPLRPLNRTFVHECCNYFKIHH